MKSKQGIEIKPGQRWGGTFSMFEVIAVYDRCSYDDRSYEYKWLRGGTLGIKKGRTIAGWSLMKNQDAPQEI